MKSVAIVTGGAHNIGAAIVRRLAERYHVVIADLVEPTYLLPDDCEFIRGDVCEPDQIAGVFEQAAQYGAIEAVVHSAAITAPAKPLPDISIEEWRRVLEVNLTGSFIIAQTAATHLKRSGGSLTFLTSRAGKTGFAALNADSSGTKPHYCASKAGVISLMKSLAIELAPLVRVNAIAPGPIEGDMIPSDAWPKIAKQVPLARLGTPDEVADAAFFLTGSAASFITGHVLDVNGGTLMD